MAVLKCPKGKIARSSYTTKRGVHVRPACVPDKGAPGKTPASRKVLPIPKKGSLGKYSYGNIKHTAAGTRRKALKVAVESEGYAPIIRRLNLLANYTKVSDPETYKIMRADMAWIQKNMYSHSKVAQRKGSKKVSRKGSKKGSKKVSRKGSKKGSRKGSKKGSKKASKKASRKGSKKVSRKASKKRIVMKRKAHMCN